MTRRFKYSIAAVFLILIISGHHFFAKPNSPSPSGSRVEHDLTIVHPGDATAKPMPHTLVQVLDKEGEPSAYSMWVDSVICRDKTCDVVKVQLHWDALGRYQRYEVAYGFQLTKLDHVPFTKEDLVKLQRILKDINSPLKEVEKEAMIAKAPTKISKSKKSSAAVDGVSGATVLTLKTAVIIGAGYTCYDLWHWSNGLLTGHIRDFTGRDSSEKKLQTYLASENPENALFALEYLKQRRIADQASFDAVVARSRKGDETLIKPTLAYLRETAPEQQDYYDCIVSLFSKADSKKRLLVLEALMSDSIKPVAGFYDHLSAYLPELESYYEAHLFLNLMEKRNPSSAKVADNTAKLLKHKKFFVSRRAYWYLEKQKLPADLQKLADAYYKENEDRL